MTEVSTKFNNLDGRTSTVDVRYVLELASMDNPIDPREYTTVSGVLALNKGYTTADVLVNALDSVDVPAGTYAVKLVADGINKLIFIHVAGNSAIELVAPGFVTLQCEQYTPANYTDMYIRCGVLICNMVTGAVTRVHGYVTVDEATRSVALSSGITRSLDDCTYCARVPTHAGSYLEFFRVQHGTVKYLRAPEFVAHRGY